MVSDLLQTSARMLDAKTVGRKLGCSWRTVYRYADGGLMPWGRKVGTLRRWDARELDEWIRTGCKPVRR